MLGHVMPSQIRLGQDKPDSASLGQVGQNSPGSAMLSG
jgi:hypothetical protein